MPYKNKEDRAEQSRRWAEKNRERSREIKRKSRRKNYGVEKAKREVEKADPYKQKRNLAEYRFRFAIKKGWIVRQEGKSFHHPDYERPYYGAWVTELEHRRIHAGLQNCPDCVDYSEHVNEQRRLARLARNKNGAAAANKRRWRKA